MTLIDLALNLLSAVIRDCQGALSAQGSLVGTCQSLDPAQSSRIAQKEVLKIFTLHLLFQPDPVINPQRRPC